MTNFDQWLFRWRGTLVGIWAILVATAYWPAVTWTPSLALVVLGIALRLWARRYIGPHSRGQQAVAVERSMAGPYRFVAHPLYVANLLVIAGLLLQLLGLSLFVLVWLAFPVGLYARLGHAESMLLKRQAPPLREAPFQWTTGRWRSEWASVLPPFVLWLGFALWP